MHNVELYGTRVVNRRNEHEDIYIGRGGNRGLGNPFTHIPLGATKAKFQCKTREESIAKCEEWVLTQPSILAQIDSLAGKRLGCYCDPLPCHGMIYVLLVATYKAMRTVFDLEPRWETAEDRAVIAEGYYRIKEILLREHAA